VLGSNPHGLIFAGTVRVRYGVPALILEAVRRTGSSCCHNGAVAVRVTCAASAVDFVKMSKNTKLLRTRHAFLKLKLHQNSFSAGAPLRTPAGGAYDAPPDPVVSWKEGYLLQILLPLDPLGVSIDSTATSGPCYLLTSMYGFV